MITEAEVLQLTTERDKFRQWFIAERAKTTALQAEVTIWQTAEHELSDAYVRLRRKLKAFDTPYAPTGEQVWEVTEKKLDEVLAELADLQLLAERQMVELTHLTNAHRGAETQIKLYQRSLRAWKSSAKDWRLVADAYGDEAHEQKQRAALAEHTLVEERDRHIEQLNTLEQTLAQALGGFPWYKDDQLNFPGATAESGVCTGESTIEDLVDMVVKALTAERAKRCGNCVFWFKWVDSKGKSTKQGTCFVTGIKPIDRFETDGCPLCQLRKDPQSVG